MKKILIHTNSLFGKAFTALLGVIEKYSSDAEFLILCNLEKTAAAADVLNEYRKVMVALKEKNAHIRELDEYSLDEYLFSNKTDKIYLSPVEGSSQMIVASAAILGFEGKLYLFACSENQPPVINLTDDILVFQTKKRSGLTHLDRTDVDYTYSPGDKCYFTIDGKKYCETIKDRSNVADSGTEGFTQICESDNSYRLKIYDCLKKTKKGNEFKKKKYEIERLCAMIEEQDNEDIALPLASVTDSNGNIIGFVMRNIKGAEPLDISRLRFDTKALCYTRDILTQLLWLETRSFLHHDVDHNIVKGSDGKAHIIDTDSVQYKVWPSSAYSMEPINALPDCYKSDSYYFNTVDLSYTALCLLVAAIVDHTKIFGKKLDNGFYEINEDVFLHLVAIAPELAPVFSAAYTKGQPVSIARLLEINEGFIADTEQAGDDEADDEEIREAEEQAEEIVSRLKAEEYKKPEHIIRNGQDDTLKKKNVEKNEKNPQETNDNNGNGKVGMHVEKPPEDIGYSFLDYIRYEIILPMLMTGTAVFGESKADTYKRLMAEGKWKRLLGGSLLILFVIVVLFAAILII